MLDNELQQRQKQRVHLGHESSGAVGDEDEDVFGIKGPAVAVQGCVDQRLFRDRAVGNQVKQGA